MRWCNHYYFHLTKPDQIKTNTSFSIICNNLIVPVIRGFEIIFVCQEVSWKKENLVGLFCIYFTIIGLHLQCMQFCHRYHWLIICWLICHKSLAFPYTEYKAQLLHWLKKSHLIEITRTPLPCVTGIKTCHLVCPTHCTTIIHTACWGGATTVRILTS